jgi:hypothetical protein
MNTLIVSLLSTQFESHMLVDRGFPSKREAHVLDTIENQGLFSCNEIPEKKDMRALKSDQLLSKKCHSSS